MKKATLPLLFIATLCFTSCKKDYNCDCTSEVRVTESGTSYSFDFSNESTTYSSKMTEKQATAACDHEQESIESTLKNNITENGTSPMPSEVQVNVECKLK